ncbi:MAG: hypothetical protein GC149_20555 [Gammaproteobacteria bacterium]|nr:hypothetical protein [Gammaproteobacteria bacterium]
MFDMGRILPAGRLDFKGQSSEPDQISGRFMGFLIRYAVIVKIAHVLHDPFIGFVSRAVLCGAGLGHFSPNGVLGTSVLPVVGFSSIFGMLGRDVRLPIAESFLF